MLLGRGEHLSLRWLKNTLQTTQQGKRQNHAPILALLEITAQKVGNRPDKSGGLRVIGFVVCHTREAPFSALSGQFFSSRRLTVSRCFLITSYSARIRWCVSSTDFRTSGSGRGTGMSETAAAFSSAITPPVATS